MKTAWMIALESGLYLGVGGHSTSAFAHAERWLLRKDAKAAFAKLLGWPKARIIKVDVS